MTGKYSWSIGIADIPTHPSTKSQGQYMDVYKLIHRDGYLLTHTNYDNNNPDYDGHTGSVNVPFTLLESLVIKAIQSQEGVQELASYLTMQARSKIPQTSNCGLTKKQYHKLLSDTLTLMKEYSNRP